MSTEPYLNMEEAAALFGYTNRRAATHAIKLGRFEVPVFKMAGKNVVSMAVIKKYFDDRGNEGILEMELSGSTS